MGENSFNYDAELAKLHIELVHLQEWVKSQKLKVVIIFEGRDASGNFSKAPEKGKFALSCSNFKLHTWKTQPRAHPVIVISYRRCRLQHAETLRSGIGLHRKSTLNFTSCR